MGTNLYVSATYAKGDNFYDFLFTSLENIAGCPRLGKKSGKNIFFQGQGIVREFLNLSGNFGICQKSGKSQRIMK